MNNIQTSVPFNDCSDLDFECIRSQVKSIFDMAKLAQDEDGQTPLSIEVRNYLEANPLSQAQADYLQLHSATHIQRNSHMATPEGMDLADNIAHHLTDALGKEAVGIDMVFEAVEMEVVDKLDTELIRSKRQRLISLCQMFQHNVPIIFSGEVNESMPHLSGMMAQCKLFLTQNSTAALVSESLVIQGEYYTKIDAKKWENLNQTRVGSHRTLEKN